MNLPKYFPILFIFIFWVLFIYSCAAIQAPSGGPRDETPPELIESLPKNGTVFFPGGRVELVFTEYLAENTISNAITIMPRMNEDPELIYKGRRVFVEFPNNLTNDQTYIVSINRTLKDEHGVFLKKGLQVAYSTGSKINNGSIEGTINHKKPASAQLWKIISKKDDSLFYQRQPDYVIDASDKGNYHFQFLSSGDYKLISVDQSLSRTVINPNRTLAGLPWLTLIQLGSDETLESINMMIPEKSYSKKMNRAEWITESWFKLFFSENISEVMSLLPLQVFLGDSILSVLDLFLDNEDKTIVHAVLPESLRRPGLVTFSLNSIFQGDKTILDSSRVSIRIDTTQYKKNVKIDFPLKSYVHPIDEEIITPLQISFSSFMEKSNISAPIELIKDSINVSSKYNWISPLTLEVTPLANWEPKKNYQLHIDRDNLKPVFGEPFIDSLTTLSFKTSDYIRFGRLLGKVESSLMDGIVLQVKHLKNKFENLYTIVNSDGTFLMNRLPEGDYSLLFFQDDDGDNRYSYGSLDPHKPAEWYYVYPDTVLIRGNWDMELKKIQFNNNLYR